MLSVRKTSLWSWPISAVYKIERSIDQHESHFPKDSWSSKRRLHFITHFHLEAFNVTTCVKIGLKEVFKFDYMRDQLRFLQFDVDCNFFWHRWVPADVEIPVGHPESWFGVFCMNVFARPGMWDVICTVWTDGTHFWHWYRSSRVQISVQGHNDVQLSFVYSRHPCDSSLHRKHLRCNIHRIHCIKRSSVSEIGRASCRERVCAIV